MTESGRCQVATFLAENFPAHAVALQKLSDDVDALYQGHWPAWQSCQVPYHTLDHVWAVLLAALRMLAGHGRLVQQPLELTTVKVLAAAALFHDSGYLKQRHDNHPGHGGQYTFEHVERSQQLVDDYLQCQPGWSCAQRQQVQTLIAATKIGVEQGGGALGADEQWLCNMLASADLLAQVADPCYIQKLPLLYAEFEEAYHCRGRQWLRERGFWVFDSYQHLLSGSGTFIRAQVLPRLQAMGNQELALQAYYAEQPSPYFRRLMANLHQLDVLSGATAGVRQ